LNYKTQGFNQYEYKLLASDGSWQDNGSNNELKLLLSPGEYVIQVRLKNLPPSVTQLKVYVRPPFYQTIWFALLVIVGIAAAVALLVNRQNKIKYRKKIALLEMQQKIQGEKERIARDLHDNIGVQANALLYGTEQLQKLHPDEDSLVDNLQSTAKDMMQSLRETVWAMKNTSAKASDIWLRIISFCNQLNLIYKEIKISVEGEAPENIVLNPARTLHIVLIIQEAINNAVRHAKARRIVVKSDKDDNGWWVSIDDDGYGFDKNAGSKTPGGGYGLSNMQERATMADISLSVNSQLEKGTSVTLYIPFEKKQGA
jgi:signal transduction histidine kinase